MNGGEGAAAAYAYVAPRNPLRAWPTVILLGYSPAAARGRNLLKTTLAHKRLSERIAVKHFKALRALSLQKFSLLINDFLQFSIEFGLRLVVDSAFFGISRMCKVFYENK